MAFIMHRINLRILSSHRGTPLSHFLSIVAGGVCVVEVTAGLPLAELTGVCVAPSKVVVSVAVKLF